MKPLFVISLFTLALAMRPPCGAQCRFSHCSTVTGDKLTGLNRIALGPANIARLGPVICESGVSDTVGFILKTGEPIRESASEGDTPLKKWKPEGLSAPYSKKFIFTKKLDKYKKSSFARKPHTGNQLLLLHDECIRVPILRYQVLKKKTREVKRVVMLSKNDDGACVSLRPRASYILVELDWQGRDDLDLRVTEPDGDRLGRSNISTESGKFFQDNGSETCFKPDVVTGREGVIYRVDKPLPELGEYTVEAFHFNNCGNGPTEWHLRVTINGFMVLSEEGKSDGDENDLIVRRTISFEG